MTTIQDRRPVVVGVDGTEHSQAALRRAIGTARSRGVGLRIVHVEPGFRPVMPHVLMMETDLEVVGQQILREADAVVGEIAPDLPVHTSLRRGPRVAELVAAAEQAQLLVLGNESMHGLDRLLLGTTTAGVAAHASCPVRVVPEGWTDRQGPVVVGVRATEQVAALVDAAACRAATRGRHVVVVHAWHLPHPYADRIEARVHAEDWRAAGHEALNATLDQVRQRHPDVRFEVRVVHADPVTALLDVQGTSLVVVQRRRRAGWLPGSLGRTVRHLLSRSALPVEVVPQAAVPDDLESSPGAEAAREYGVATAQGA